jgi:ABC transport system ATP-binding/permease protein
MALITLSQIQLAFGHVALLDHVDFSLQPLERVGLIGRNGAGKSSFLKLLAGTQKPDDGVFQQQQGLRCAYVAQEADFAAAASVFDTVAAPLNPIRQAREQYEVLACDANADMGELTKLQDFIDSQDGWSWETRVETVLTRLQIDGSALIGTLSGGQQKRVALAQGLVTAPDVLLLDEPTNHLDMKTIDWLATLMCDTPCALLFITHDRAFLDSVATRIIELDRGQLRSYPGNFAAWQAARALELNAEELENARADKLLAQEEIWVRQGVKARRTRAQYRVNQLEILRNARAARRDQVGQVKLDVDAGSRSGKLVAELDGVHKAFGEGAARKTILSDFSATILRGDKIGIVGRNGAGKTTLLRTILGELPPDSGKVKTGSNLQVAYFDQLREQLDLDQTLVDTISPGSEWVEFGGQRKHVMSYLGDFLFSPARANSPVRSLSGGERNRLLLARLFARPANVLVLDEPTNDLDIDTLELLEQLLAEYSGTVFLVSHDRAFLDNVVTSLIVHEGDDESNAGPAKAGYWREYEGGITDWQAQTARAATHAKVNAAKANLNTVTAKNTNNAATAPAPVSGKKLSYKDKQLLEKLPSEIAALELEQTDIHNKLSKSNALSGGYGNDVGALQAAMRRMDEIETQLDAKLTQWAALEG